METTEKAMPQVGRQNPLTFYLRTLLYMFMALVMRVVAFLPLGALFLFPEGSYWRWLAVLCPILVLLFILPQRFSFAQALVQTDRERRFSFDKATGLTGYGAKLGQSVLHLLHIVLWGIPLWLMLGGIYYVSVSVDMDQVLKGINSLGAGVMTVLFAVANFFIGIFGGTQLVPNGGMAEGLTAVGAALGLGLLILLWGAMRNSAYRYIWAYAVKTGRKPREEARRRLRGRRWKQFWVAMLNLLLWVPAALVVITSFKSMLNDLINALYGVVLTRQMNLPDFSTALYPLIFAFLVCYMPLLPVRRILTAFFATKQIRRAPVAQPETAPTAPVTPVAPEAAKPVAAPVAAEKPAAPFATYIPETPAPAAQPVYTPTPAKTAPEPEPEPDEPVAPAQPVPVYTPYRWEAAPAPKPVVTEPAVAEPVVMEPTPAVQTAPEPAVTEQPAPVAETRPEPMAWAYQAEPETVAAAPVAETEPETEDAFVQPAAYPTIDEPETPTDHPAMPNAGAGNNADA